MVWAVAFFINTQVVQGCALAVGTILMSLFVVNQSRLNFFRCPRCGRCFFIRFPLSNSFARRCMHCGLPRWAKDDLPEDNS
jgi:hypothetical protein